MAIPICSNPNCKTSTGIHGLLTHGTGYLDGNGFWQYECPETYGKHVAQDIEIYQILGETFNIKYLKDLASL